MSYNLLAKSPIFTAGDMSGNLTSKVVEVKNQDNVGIQLSWTGTPTGAFVFEISIDHSEDMLGNVRTPGSWVAITLSPAISAAGSADSAYIDLNQLSAAYIRVRYTVSASTGVLTGFVACKGV